MKNQRPEGYIQDNRYYYFEIREDGEIVVVENMAGVGFVNQPVIGGLEITKKDISDGKLLPGVGFQIKNENGKNCCTRLYRRKRCCKVFPFVMENTPIRNLLRLTATNRTIPNIRLRLKRTAKLSRRKWPMRRFRLRLYRKQEPGTMFGICRVFIRCNVSLFEHSAQMFQIIS